MSEQDPISYGDFFSRYLMTEDMGPTRLKRVLLVFEQTLYVLTLTFLITLFMFIAYVKFKDYKYCDPPEFSYEIFNVLQSQDNQTLIKN